MIVEPPYAHAERDAAATLLCQLWRVVDSTGATIAYTPSRDRAYQILRDFEVAETARCPSEEWRHRRRLIAPRWPNHADDR